MIDKSKPAGFKGPGPTQHRGDGMISVTGIEIKKSAILNRPK
jgi:hypothetical protein